MPILYVGTDIAKSSIDIAFVIDKKYHAKYPNHANGFAQIEIFAKNTLTQNSTTSISLHFILESTSTYWQDFAHWAHAQGHRVSVINPTFIHAYGKSLGLRDKTDKVDALLLARYGSREQPTPWQPAPTHIVALVALNRQLAHAKTRLVCEKIRLDTAHADTRPFVLDSIAYWRTQITQLYARIWQMIGDDPVLYRRATLLQTIPGIGKKTAILLVPLILPEKFKSAKHLASFVGVVPRLHQSGSSVHKLPAVGYSGRADIREGLYMPAVAICFGKHRAYRAFVDRLLAHGKNKQQIIIAMMRKLLVIAYQVIVTDTPFDPSKHS